eukprot:644866-Amorphochlora_amoeboformis.AAC.1
MAAHADLVPKSGIKFAKDQRFKEKKAEGPESFLGHKDLVAKTVKFGSGSRFEPERPATTGGTYLGHNNHPTSSGVKFSKGNRFVDPKSGEAGMTMRAHGDLLAPTTKFSSSQRFCDKPNTGGGTVM